MKYLRGIEPFTDVTFQAVIDQHLTIDVGHTVHLFTTVFGYGEFTSTHLAE